MSNIVKIKMFRYVLDWFEVKDVEINIEKYSYFEFQLRSSNWYLIGYGEWDGKDFPRTNTEFQLDKPKEAAKALGDMLSRFSFIHGLSHEIFAKELAKILQ